MIKTYPVCILLFFCSVFSMKSQDSNIKTDELIATIFEQYSSENEENIDFESFYEDLMSCATNPINLNQTDRSALEKLQFLSEIQVENILTYVYEFGPIQSIYELQLIDGLDMTDIRRMLAFVRIGESDDRKQKIYWSDLLRYGNNELLFRLDKGLETKEGYQQTGNNDLNGSNLNPSLYLGNELYNSIKYRYQYKERVYVGLSAEKDAGEQFWGVHNKGYDFYSFHLQLNSFWKFKTIVMGDYRVNFGQGLVMHPEFGSGKSSYVLNVTPRNSGLKKYSSTDEYNFFRGGGATLALGKFEITGFYSNKMIDGDTLNAEFRTIIKTGYHRTENELQQKKTVNQQVIGVNVNYVNGNLQLGATMVYTRLNFGLIPETSGYNYYSFTGNKQTSGGVSYRYRWKKINFFGETAISNNNGYSTLNGCFYSPISQVNLVLLQRYFSPEYDTFYASAFSESSSVNNESGWYLGAEIRPFRKWKFSFYADNYNFMWPKYGVDAPSIGEDYLFQADFSVKRNMSMFWRFKYKKTDINLPNSVSTLPVIIPQEKASVKYQLTYTIGNFSFKNVVEGNWVQMPNSNGTYGVTALQDISYDFPQFPMKIDIRFQFFDAVNYENRFYSYEKDVLYAFSIPMNYGLGSRYYLNVSFNVNKQLSLWLKLAQTTYADDRETLSSANETITGNRKTDIRFLLKWTF